MDANRPLDIAPRREEFLALLAEPLFWALFLAAKLLSQLRTRGLRDWD